MAETHIDELALLGVDRDEEVLHRLRRNDLREALAPQLAGQGARRKRQKLEAILLGRRMEFLEPAARGIRTKGIHETISHAILQGAGHMGSASKSAAEFAGSPMCNAAEKKTRTPAPCRRPACPEGP